MTKKIEDGGLPEDLIDAAAAICRGLGIPSNPTNCFPIIEGMKADRQRDQWQPIETAPTDGTRFLGFWPSPEDYADQNAPCEIRTWRQGDRWECPYESSDTTVPPTHWMPLPFPPRTKEGEENG